MTWFQDYRGVLWTEMDDRVACKSRYWLSCFNAVLATYSESFPNISPIKNVLVKNTWQWIWFSGPSYGSSLTESKSPPPYSKKPIIIIFNNENDVRSSMSIVSRQEIDLQAFVCPQTNHLQHADMQPSFFMLQMMDLPCRVQLHMQQQNAPNKRYSHSTARSGFKWR